jgi:DNA-binding response OmpR family regulator
MKRIAIITENIIFIKLLKSLLDRKIPDSHITHFSSFPDIKEQINQANFDLILVDGIISGVASFEIINYLRHEKKVISPVYYFSEARQDYIRVKAYEIGVNYYYEKPFDPHKVTNEIVTNLTRGELIA